MWCHARELIFYCFELKTWQQYTCFSTISFFQAKRDQLSLINNVWYFFFSNLMRLIKYIKDFEKLQHLWTPRIQVSFRSFTASFLVQIGAQKEKWISPCTSQTAWLAVISLALICSFSYLAEHSAVLMKGPFRFYSSQDFSNSSNFYLFA